MAVYKVPQDVEADDKLIGPFSFRQFVYLIIVAIAIAIAWGLGNLFIPLAIIPLPVILFFGALALPLRKDQPMEIYLAAVVSFHLKPRKRLWQADGIQSLVEITAPKVVEVVRSKDLSQSEAERRLSYLADIVDTGGWAIRNVAGAQAATAMQSDVYFAAQQTEDMLANDGGVSRTFDTMISQADVRRRQEVLDRMHQTENQTMAVPAAPATPAFTASALADPYANLNTTPAVASQPVADPSVSYNPYPNSMRQSIITPLSEQPAQAPTPSPQAQQSHISTPAPQAPAAPPAQITTSENVVSPDIMNLANNPDLSIETIAHEANRIHQQEEQNSSDEVVISLR